MLGWTQGAERPESWPTRAATPGRGDIFLLDRFKAQVSLPETLRAIRALCARYPQARTILVEDTANGPAVIETLMHEIPGIIAITPKGGKAERAAACAPRVEAGNVYLPRPTAPNGRRVPARASRGYEPPT